jgi:hypothetical protein
MPKMTESQRVWEAWMSAFSRIHDAAPADADVACPSCDKGRVRVSYTGDPQSRIGYAIAWCDVCLHGIHLSRVRIPDGVEMLTFESTEAERDAVVPDIQLISPDPWIDDESYVESD